MLNIVKQLKQIFCAFFLSCAVISAFAQITDSVSSYNSVYYRGSAIINVNEQILNCQFNVVNVVDSLLYIHLSVAGLEAGRALATPDNFLYINKLQKNYYDGDYTFFQQFLELDIDFYTFQAIFTGIPTFLPEEAELSYGEESVGDQFPFFKTLTFEYYGFVLQLEVKKVTFNAAPEVSAVVPKNFTSIISNDD